MDGSDLGETTADAQKMHLAKRECQVLPLQYSSFLAQLKRNDWKIQDLSFWQLAIARNWPKELNFQCFEDKQT